MGQHSTGRMCLTACGWPHALWLLRVALSAGDRATGGTQLSRHGRRHSCLQTLLPAHITKISSPIPPYPSTPTGIASSLAHLHAGNCHQVHPRPTLPQHPHASPYLTTPTLHTHLHRQLLGTPPTQRLPPTPPPPHGGPCAYPPASPGARAPHLAATLLRSRSDAACEEAHHCGRGWRGKSGAGQGLEMVKGRGKREEMGG